MGFTFLTQPQESTPLPQSDIFYAPNGNPDWLSVKENIQVTAKEIIGTYLPQLGLGMQDELINYRTQTDELGMTHYRYQQYHQGVKVEGGELLIHERHGRVQTLNGKLVRALKADVRAEISAEDAIHLAKAYLPAERYMWENTAAERLLKRIKKDPTATFYPEPELVLVDPSLQQNAKDFHLAYSMTIQAESPLMNQLVFVDAKSGEILRNIEQLHTQNNVPGTAVTRYNGTQTIITDSIASDQYRLVETTRGGGIETYNLNGSTNFGMMEDFFDDDNHWDNVNEQQDEAATDAHWGAEMTFDYYEQVLNHSGIDGENMPLISNVHYDINVVNAFWNGNWASFGDGNGENWDALTCIDVVAHEFTHGVTGNTARLIYLNESGALNESFSDIFGAAVEFWATPDSADWFVAEDSNLDNTGFRDMANPNSKGDPDTYLSQSWVTGTTDNGGVHSNSGVQNYWFYLITDGGSGNNSFGTSYSVEGLGLDTSANIAFRNLKFYLTRFSGYFDAREGSLQAAEDLYGICSNAVVQTARAWYAVGVGPENFDNDVRLLSILSPAPVTCGLSASESISVQFRYNGCGVQLQPGDRIPMGFQVDNNAPVFDTLTLATSLIGGDTLVYTFPTTTADLSSAAVHRLRVWSDQEGDQIPINDTIVLFVDNILEQNVDLKLESLESPETGCFLGQESFRITVGFYGCDSIVAAESFEVAYRVNGGNVVSETVSIPVNLGRGETFEATLSGLIDFTATGINTIDAWINYGPDYLNSNDSLLNLKIANPVGLVDHDVLTFEFGDVALDSLYLITAPNASTSISEDAANTGNLGMQITGGNLPEAFQAGLVTLPNEFNVWFVNESFSNLLCICVDATELEVPQFSFDLKQTHSPYYLVNFGTNVPLASSMRVLINDEPISDTYNPNTYRNDPWKTHVFSLADYVGGSVEICFESRTLLNKVFDPANFGDNVYLDNITIGGRLVDIDPEPTPTGSIEVFPNPGNGQFMLSFQADGRGEISINVVNHFGQTVKKMVQNITSGKQNSPLDLNELPAGIYRLQIGLGQERFIKSVVKM
ncbi:MAG: hypothetical protein DHS20C18_23880 [Saprospiraceae bacterium]|nr:MAG: hypothetical protein DHS20C18_23880 [Saprospiraceae bacterium]